MLNGDHGRHAVAHVGSGEICVLFLQDAQLPSIIVDYSGKYGLKAGQVGAALCVVDVVAEAQNIFMKLVYILESALYHNALCFALEVNDVVDLLFFLIQILNKTDDSVLLMELHFFGRLCSAIRKVNGQFGIQVSGLVETAFDLLCLKSCFFKDLRVGKEVDSGSCLLGFT